MEDEKVKQLAETLRKNGLAASEYEALEKARSILNIKIQKEDVSQEEAQPVRETKQAMHNLDIDIKHQNISLNELMREVNVTPEEVEAQEKEKLSDLNTDILEIKEDIKQAEKNPEKISQVKEEIEKIKSEADEIMESKEESKSTVKSDMFKDEKKIDLAKVFNYKNRSSR